MNFLSYKVLNQFRSKTPAGYYDPVKGHTGIDLSTPTVTDLALPFPATFLEMKKQSEMGNTAYLRNEEDDTIHVFAHLTGVSAKPMQKLQADEVFGKSGNTGKKTIGPHLHYEIISALPADGLDFMTRTLAQYKGFNIDPIAYFKTQFSEEEEAVSWMLTHEIIKLRHGGNTPVTWRELCIVSKRLAKKILDWTRNPKDDGKTS